MIELPIEEMAGTGSAEPEVRRLLARAVQLAGAKHTEEVEPHETWSRLNAHGLDDAEISRQLASLKWNTPENKTAAITTYSYLHGLQHLDAINAARGARSGPAAAIVALFQAGEICLGASASLTARMLGDLSRASSAMRSPRAAGGAAFSACSMSSGCCSPKPTKLAMRADRCALPARLHTESIASATGACGNG